MTDNEWWDETRICGECDKPKPQGCFSWTKDRYNIPYRKVCEDCYDAVQEEISGFVFDPNDAGESLEEP